MYKMKPGNKNNPELRWGLPDRIFFGNGACHILAGVYLKQSPLPGFYAERIIPSEGLAGNHIYVTNGDVAFDYHGYSIRQRLLNYHKKNWASRYSEEWNCQLKQVSFDLLSAKELNARKMLGPDQYLYDAAERARIYIMRIDHQKAFKKALLRSLKAEN